VEGAEPIRDTCGGGTVKDLTLKDLLFILAFPYIIFGYALLCLLYAPIEYIMRFKKRIKIYKCCYKLLKR
jgi:hypothetical protein